MRLPRPGFTAASITLIACLAAPPAAPRAAADPLFQSAFESYDAGHTSAFISGLFQSTPAAVATGDMNGDGLVDLVVAAPGGPTGAFQGSTVSVLLRRAGGAPPLYRDKINATTGTGPIAVALADLNSDGKLDAVTADYTGGTISILLGDGSGGLVLDGQKTVGTNPRGVATGDLTGDGVPDVVVANSGSNTITVFQNLGGVLGARQDYATQIQPRDVAIASFNGDAAEDVVACNYVTGTLSFFFNTGTGALNPAMNVPLAAKPTALAVGLLDANGTPDVAVACSSQVVTRLSNGMGGFSGGLSLSVPVELLAITVGNLTGAATPDIAATGTAAAGAPNVVVIPDVSGASAGATLLARGGPVPSGIEPLSDLPGMVVANLGDLATGGHSHTVSVLRRNLAGGFNSGLEVVAGAFARRASTADLNRDGVLDLVVSGEAPNGLMTAIGTSPGSFAAPTAVLASASVDRVVTADLNRDGLPDIVYERLDTAQIEAMFGAPAGGFSGPVGLATTTGPFAVGDLNRDGIPDLVVTSGIASQVYLGNGAGGVSPGMTYTAPPLTVSLRSVTLGDLNRDAKVDMVVTTDRGLLRYLGNGDGTFAPHVLFQSTHGTRAGVIADLNLDGVPDLAYVEEGVPPIEAGEPQGIAVMLGTGLGGFGVPALFPALDLPRSLEVADVNRDGRPDLLAKSGSDVESVPPVVSVLLGNGSGAFALRTDHAAGERAEGLALADVTRDGLLDIVGTGLGNAGGVPRGIVHILPGSAPGSFGTLGARTDFGISAMSARGIASGDVDRDGKNDVVMVGLISGAPYAVTQLGNGAGGFYGGLLTDLSGLDPQSVALADLNRDGHLDMIVGNGNSSNVYVLLGNGGVFGVPGARPTHFPPYTVAVGDVDRDGILDLATGNPTSSTISILIGSGNGGFAAPAMLSSVNPVTGIAFGDLSRDGRLDLVATGGGTGIIRVHLQEPGGTWNQNGNVTIGPNPMSPVFGDYNRDGIPDVAVGSTGGGGRVTVMYGNAFGQLIGPNEFGLPNFPTQLAAADLDRDGVMDLVASNATTVSVLHGAGGPGGGFDQTTHYPCADSPQGVVLADMNQDGWLDVVTGNSPSQTSSVFLNGGSVPTGVVVGSTPAPAARLLQNAPNPFNPRTVIRFVLPRAGRARLTVHDVAGRRIATLLDGPASAGERRIEWTGRDDDGRGVASGIYFYKLEAEGVTLSRKMTLLQ